LRLVRSIECGLPRRLGQASGGFNHSANSPQANPNKTKQKSLDFLGFIRPNRDFSKGCEQKNKKNRIASQVVCKTSQTDLPLFLPSTGGLAWRGFEIRNGKSMARVSDFGN
jgi:hypothetical protein